MTRVRRTRPRPSPRETFFVLAWLPDRTDERHFGARLALVTFSHALELHHVARDDALDEIAAVGVVDVKRNAVAAELPVLEQEHARSLGAGAADDTPPRVSVA